MAFTTSDENNSNIILGIPDASRLGGIKGRAILIDGLPETVQVPYIENAVAERLLKSYYREDADCDPTGQIDYQASETLPSFITTSVRDIGMP